MKTEVVSVGMTVKLHYDVKEDLLNVGAVAESPDMGLSDWALGTRADIMKAALRLLAETKDDELLVIGVLPSGKPSEGSLTPEEVELPPSTLGYE